MYDVTAIIVTQGREEVCRAVRSALSEQVAEVIVVTDRISDDGLWTLSALEDLQRVRIIASSGKGANAARNVGIDAASTTWVSFLDDDDEWCAGKIAIQLEVVQNSPGALEFSTTSVYFNYRNGRREELPRGRTAKDSLRALDTAMRRKRLCANEGFIQTSTFLVRRSSAAAVRWDEELQKHQDWDFFYRFGIERPSTWSHINLPLAVVYQGSAGSTSRRYNPSETARWLDRIFNDVSRRAMADQVGMQVLRQAAATRSATAFLHGLRWLCRLRRVPHAAVVAIVAVALVRGG